MSRDDDDGVIGGAVSALLWRLFYFAVVTPVALVLRARGRQPLALRLDRDAASYWIARPSGLPPGEAPPRRVQEPA
jgi:hypothetical protein